MVQKRNDCAQSPREIPDAGLKPVSYTASPCIDTCLQGLPREGVKEAISHLEFLAYKHRRAHEQTLRARHGTKPSGT